MPRETLLIALRRIGQRPLESTLLILALALGLGSSSLGIALLEGSLASSRKALASPSSREIAAAGSRASFSGSDLGAASLAPAVILAYAESRREARILGLEGIGPFGEYLVTSGFFEAQGLKAASGELGEKAESSGSPEPLVLGAEAALRIGGRDEPAAELVGRELPTEAGMVRVIGILKPSSNPSFDQACFSPWEPLPGRSFPEGTQLRFAVGDPSRLAETEDLLSRWFEERYGSGVVAVTIPSEEARRLAERDVRLGLRAFELLSIALVVALGAAWPVIRRRRARLGLRSSILVVLGAPRPSLFGLFASDALALCLAGAVLGWIGASALAPSLRSALGLQPAPWALAAAGAAISWAIASAVSAIPAWKDSREAPSKALPAL
jgi:putative ABC transport system permease protein